MVEKHKKDRHLLLEAGSRNTTKERFYEELCRALKAVSTTDKLIVLGDLNSCVGSDHETWDRVLGRFGRGNCNDNGELLLSLRRL